MENANEKKFNLSLNRAGKIMNAMVQGFYKPEDANGFVADYSSMVHEIKPAEYELHFDCSNLKVTSQDMLPMLSACMEMYKKDGFKKIVFGCGSNPTLKMQIQRVARNAGLANFEVI
jgi:hypothetical protein